MYGKQKNSYGNLVSELKGQLKSAQSLLYIIYAYWQFEDICASGCRSREFRLNELSK